ncbi:MAG TPA: hypothetical protein VGL81_29770 [Polyangiaceae bacterium]
MFPLRRAFERWRPALVGVVLLAATAKFLLVVNGHYPVREWLFWLYAEYLLLCAGWALACVSTGHRVVLAVWRHPLPLVEHVTLAFAAGLLVFFLLMFAGGLLGILGPVFSVALPLAMFAFGANPLRRTAARCARHLRHARRARRGAPPLWVLPTVVFGLAGVAMLYLDILTPQNIAYDSRWYHLSLAESYAAEGAIRATPEGWFQAALPQLASVVYSWAFQLPWFRVFDRVELAAHLEFTVFVFTLAGIPALVRAVVPGARAHLAWVATFLFPGILLYDSSLSGAADHIAALWAVPIVLTLRRALPRLEPRRCLLFGAMLAGAALTKYQAVALLAGPVLAFGARAVWLSVHRRQPIPWQGAVAAAGTVLLLTAPHWLKNWVFYGDPIYPFLYKHLHVHPWTVDSAHRFEVVFQGQLWRPEGTFLHRVSETLWKGVLGFSFEPNDWPMFHRDIPVFGSLFTLLFFVLPFVRRGGRAALLFTCGNVGVFVWYWLSHQDRYLQALLPWMAAAVAAALILVWRTGRLGRIATVPLLAAQILWGGDVYFIPTHAMNNTSPIKLVADLLSAHYRGDRNRFATYSPWSDIGQDLPRGAKVLVHQSHVHLGLESMSVSDWGGWQGGLSYARLGDPRAVYERLASYGVTHLVWLSRNEPWRPNESDSLAGDLAFFRFATLYAVDPKRYGEATLARMPPSAPEGPFGDHVLVRVCGGAPPYADGYYDLTDLALPAETTDPTLAPQPRSRVDCTPRAAACDPVLGDVAFVVVKPGCDPSVEPRIAGYRLMTTRGEVQLWARVNDGGGPR